MGRRAEAEAAVPVEGDSFEEAEVPRLRFLPDYYSRLVRISLL